MSSIILKKLCKYFGQIDCRIYTTQPMDSEVLVHLKAEAALTEIRAKSPEDQCLDLKAEMWLGVELKRGNIYQAENEQLIGSFGF